jgi:hypothetical protein
MAADLGHLAQAQAGLVGGGEGGAAEKTGQQTEWVRTGPAMADQQALHAFAQWVAGCSGNEKQEAQTFVQKLLSARAQEEFMARKFGMGRAAATTDSN